jgi:hypothetical protein
VGDGVVVVAGGAVVVGTETVVGAVVGAWIEGSDFSPQPAAATAAPAAAATSSGRSRAPAFAPRITRAP